MRDSLPYRAAFVLFGAFAVAGLATPLLLAVFGTGGLFQTIIKDDGFYYLTLARNIADGHGATFDGLGATNGFHPLWAMLLVPVFALAGESLFAPIRILLVLAAGLHLATGFAVHRAARAVAGPDVALLVALFFVGNPLGLYLVVSGMEAPLVGLFVALLAGEAVLLRQGRLRLADPRTAVRIGILGGLAALARTETVLLFGLVVLAGLLPVAGAASLARRVRGAIVSGGAALVLVSPWLLWNLARFGTVMQTSARVLRMHAVSKRAFGDEPGLDRIFTVAGGLLKHLGNTTAARTNLPLETVLLLAAIAVGCVLWWMAALLSSRESRRDFGRRVQWLGAPFLYALGFLGAAVLLMGHIRSWYVIGPLTVVTIALALPAAYAFREEKLPCAGRVVSGLLFGVPSVALLLLGPVFARETVQNVRDLPCWEEAAQWVELHTEPEDRVASFNSGTFGYLAPRTVVNLDGVVNNRIIPYLEERRLLDFVVDSEIRYVIESRKWVKRYLWYYDAPERAGTLAPADTLLAGPVVWEVRPEGLRPVEAPAAEGRTP